MLTENKQPALPGDYCLLYGPPDFNEPDGFVFQHNLQERLGGTIIDDIHLMIQRFTPQDSFDIEGYYGWAVEMAEKIEPFQLRIHKILSRYSGFRKEGILKGETDLPEAAVIWTELINENLISRGIQPHYSFIPIYITLLKKLPENLDIIERLDTPQPIFTAEALYISKITGPGEYAIQKVMPFGQGV